MKKEDVQGKKLNNKGFSIVEILIVIAIMAILAGALAPQLMKYVEKSRKAADIQAAQTIALAVNTALVDEVAYNASVAKDVKLSDCYPGTSDFHKIIKDIIGGTTHPIPKSKNYDDFLISVLADGSFSIYAIKSSSPASVDTEDRLYPTVGKNFK